MRTFLYIISIFVAFAIHKSITFSDTNIVTVILVFLALGLYLFGTIYLTKAVSDLIFPLYTNKLPSTLSPYETKAIIEKAKDPKQQEKLNRNTLTFAILGIIFILGFGSLYFIWLDNWTDQEIKNNHAEEKIVIKSISWAKGRYADFEFDYSNIKYQNKLRDDTLQIGDTISIIFSSRNPKILRRKNAANE